MIRPILGGTGRRWVAAAGVAVALGVAGCGSSDKPSASTTGGTPTGNTIPVGILHSLSGTMAISEVSVKDSELLAIDEINKAGGVLGKQLKPVIEDGASDWPTFAEKAQKLISTDKVAATFGGWTSASRKAMLPVFERNKALLYYPVQYEGLEASPYIFYTGATTNQQIIPGLEFLKDKLKVKKLFLVGSDYVFPRTANKEIKAWAKAQRHDDRRRGVLAARQHRLRDDGQQDQGRPSPTPSSRRSTATRTSRSGSSSTTAGLNAKNAAGHLRLDGGGRGPRRRHQEHRRPVRRVELLPDDPRCREREVRQGVQGEVRRRPRHRRPDRGRLRRRAPVGGGRREGRQHRRREGQGGIQGPDLRRARRQGHGRRRQPAHLQDRAHRAAAAERADRRGRAARRQPIKPDPFLQTYSWAKGLAASGTCGSGHERASGGTTRWKSFSVRSSWA